MAESLVNEIMDAQAEDACADGNRRNGYRERALVTSVGTINLRIPKLRRGSYFPEDLLTRYSQVDRAVVAAVSEMVTCGVSTRKVERVAASLGIDRMSASQVSRICESLDGVVADLQERDLSGTSFPYIWVDATYVKCRDGGHVSSCALVTAIGAGADGYRRLLGLDAIDTESYAGWLAFLRSLRERGASGVLCVTSDAHEGLRRAIEEVFPGAAWQRCIVHLMRNAASCAPTRQKRAAVLAILHAVFDERDPALVRELYHLACGAEVVDSPGFSSFETEELNLELKHHLPETFREFQPYLDSCRFVGCSHTKEKGCAVLEAVKRGQIQKSRHNSYLRLYEELKPLKDWQETKK